MKSIYLIIFVCFFGQSSLLLATANNAGLEAELEMLLPGTGLYEQSSRIYAKERLEVLFSTLEKRKIRRKKPNKAFRIIQEEIEASFFQEFTDFASIDLLFKQGTYDQSTASALYILVFNYFDIPYTINIKASDIQLIANPEVSRSLISTPSCTGINDAEYKAFQMAYINLLRSADFLPAEEWGRSPETLYQTYYIGKTEQLNLKELASFLHYRQALNAYHHKSYVACLDWISRAQAISALPLYSVLERVVWLQLSNQNKDSNLSLHYLWKLWEATPNPVFQSEIIDRFNRKVTQLKTPTLWTIDSIYAIFEHKLGSNEGAIEQLQATNYLIQARFFAQKGSTVEVMNLMDSLYLMRPQDEGVHKVLAGMLVWSLKSERDFVKGLQRIAYYEKKYPFLAHDPIFQDQHLFYRAERVRHHYDADDYVLGNIYLQEFELLLTQMNPTIRHTSWVSTVYISSSNYFFREKEYRKAISLIETALLRVPQDDYLQHRQRFLENYLR